jgi:hypothetical protein
VTLALALTAASLSGAPSAHAQLDLRWETTRGCPARDDVLARIRAIAGAALDEDPELSVKAKIERENGRFRMELLVRHGQEVKRRVITSDSCASLAGAAAVSLELLLGAHTESGERRAQDDPSAGERDASERAERSSASGHETGRSERDGDSSVRRAQRKTEGQDASDSEPVDRDRAAPGDPTTGAPSTAAWPWSFVLRAPVLAADLALFPRPALGIGLGAGIRHRAWQIFASGYAYRAQSVSSVEPGSAFGAKLQRASGQLLTCRGRRWWQFEAAPCIALALEYVTARGFGEGVAPRLRHAIWPAVGAGLVTHWYAMESLSLFAGLSAYVELGRPRVAIQDLGIVRRLAPATVSATLGLEWIP